MIVEHVLRRRVLRRASLPLGPSWFQARVWRGCLRHARKTPMPWGVWVPALAAPVLWGVHLGGPTYLAWHTHPIFWITVAASPVLTLGALEEMLYPVLFSGHSAGRVLALVGVAGAVTTWLLMEARVARMLLAPGAYAQMAAQAEDDLTGHERLRLQDHVRNTKT